MKNKIVHVDLKGAQPLPPSKSPFWEQWCYFVKNDCHVDGLLLEWEDCLPIKVLSSSSSDDKTRFVYTNDEAVNIVKTAEKAGLQIIPLIQTFGHLEYLLKYDSYSHLREVKEYPDSLLPAEKETDESLQLIFNLLDQVLSFTPNITTIHIGGDEVWHLGNGERSKERISKEGATKIEIYLQHMNLVVQHVRRKYPSIQNILIWDDMLRSCTSDIIKKFTSEDFRNCVQLVVWQYTLTPEKYLSNSLFETYAAAFTKSPWIGTAFKGATSSCAQVPDIRHYVGNHLAWTKIADQIGPNHFSGVILTGWQRFDHFASLCELLPVAVPSLKCCVIALDKQKFDEDDAKEAFEALGISNTLPQSHCTFPGIDLFKIIVERFGPTDLACQEFFNHSDLKTWLSEWQIQNKRISPIQSRAIISKAESLLHHITEIEKDLSFILPKYYSYQTNDEWLCTFLFPLKTRLTDIITKIK